jgi:hypothetical protein
MLKTANQILLRSILSTVGISIAAVGVMIVSIQVKEIVNK